jgi:HlyD family secretion protein
VKQGDILFRLEDTPERAARDEARQQLSEGRARLEDAKKGKRPTEIEAIEAQLREAQAAQTLAEEQFVRQDRLFQRNVATEMEFDQAESEYRQARQRVARLEAELQTAHLGARSDLIEAAAAQVEAAEAALAQAEWNLSEKQQEAPQSGLVFDTLFREGEWVAAGQPIVALLPPQNIKVRAFVPEPRMATMEVGQRVRVWMDGRAAPVTGKVSFISPTAEFTPPVIYSRESRSKLVYLIEVEFDDETAATLHPGQPVDVELEARDE